MKVILYMAITVNGYIAKENDEMPWPEEEWDAYFEMVKKLGNLVIGRRTFELLQDDVEFAKKMENPFIVVVTHHLGKFDKNLVFVTTPKEALDVLKSKGFDKILVGGGGNLNSSFLKENLVDEIYLDVESVIWGKGIKLFSDENFETKIELIGTKEVSKDLVQLHYKVIKNGE